MMDRACVALDADHFEVMENQVRSFAKSYHEKESLALRAKKQQNGGYILRLVAQCQTLQFSYCRLISALSHVPPTWSRSRTVLISVRLNTHMSSEEMSRVVWRHGVDADGSPLPLPPVGDAS